MKVKMYVPMKLNPDYVMRKDQFTDFAGLHYRDRATAEKACASIRSECVTIPSKGFGVFSAARLELPEVVALCHLNLNSYTVDACFNHDEMRVSSRFGKCYNAAFNPSDVELIQVQISCDALHPKSPVYNLKHENAFDMTDIATEMENRRAGLERLAAALDRTPASVRARLKLPNIGFGNETTMDSIKLQEMYAHNGVVYTPYAHSISSKMEANFLRDMAERASVGAALCVQTLFDTVSHVKQEQMQSGCSATQRPQLIEQMQEAIKAYAEACSPNDYMIAMQLLQNAEQYVDDAIRFMKAQDMGSYGIAFDERAPRDTSGEIRDMYERRLALHRIDGRESPEDKAIIMADVLKDMLQIYDGKLSPQDVQALTTLLTEAEADIENIRAEHEYSDIDMDEPIE